MRYYFEILGVRDDAPWEHVEQAFLDQLEIWDPTRFPHDAKMSDRAKKKTGELTDAYRHLLALRSLESLDNPRQSFSINTNSIPQTPLSQRQTPSSRFSINQAAPPFQSRSTFGVTPHTLSSNISGSRLRRVIEQKRIAPPAVFSVCLSGLLVVTVMLAINIISSVGSASAGANSQPSSPRLEATTSVPQALPLALADNLTERKQAPRAPIWKPESDVSNVTSGGERDSEQRLLNAASLCDLGLVRGEHQRGASLNETNKNGETPLINAAKRNCGPVVQFLLQAGANTQAKDSSGMTAEGWAKRSNSFEVLQLFHRDRVMGITARR